MGVGPFRSYSSTNVITIVAAASWCTSTYCTLVLSNQGGSAVTIVSVSVNGVSYPANSLTGSTVIAAVLPTK